MVDPPSGTVTFLFTDIEGSTALWEEFPSGMAAAVARHDELVRRVVEGRGGYVFATTGDGFGVSFERADAAVAAAVAVQEVLGSEPWADGIQLRVRAGLHTGEADERGGDYFGPAVNRAARVMDSAHGGQVVASDLTAVVAGRLADTVVRKLGDHLLKDLAEPVEIWQVGAGEFPPLRTVDQQRNNLPSRLDELVGRQDELNEIVELVRSSPLVTMLGPGGVGKSRLAIQVAAEVVDEYPDGVWFVDLVPARDDADSVAAAIGKAMGFDVRQGESWAATVAASLSVRDVLVVLDNCEHVQGAVAGLMNSLLDVAPGVRVVATSREPVGVRGERLYPLGGLDQGPDLFVAIASALDPRFDPGDSMDAIARICARLDGMPLAIELAAGRVRSMQPEEIETRLDERFRLLRSRDRTRDPRQQSLLATVEWSYEQLADDERALFDRLGVFVGSFDLEAATGIAPGDMDDLDVADILQDLEAKSLIAARRVGSSTRYRLLETMAEFARQQLVERDALEVSRRDHARMRATLTSQRAAVADSPAADQSAAFHSLLTDLDDIESAFMWALDNDAQVAEDIFSGLRLLFTASGAAGFSRTRRFGEGLLRLHGHTRCRDRNVVVAAVGVAMGSDLTQGENAISELLARSDVEPAAHAYALSFSAWASVLHHDDPERAATLLRQAVAIAIPVDDPAYLAQIRALQLLICSFLRETTIAEQLTEFNRTEALADSIGYTAIALIVGEGAALRATDLAASTARIEQGRSIARAFGDAAGESFVDYMAAVTVLAAGAGDQAALFLTRSLPQILDRGEELAVVLAIEDIASGLYRSDRAVDAVTAYAIAARQWERLISGVRFASYKVRRERELEALATLLEPDQYQDAWDAGSKLSIDEGVRHLQTAIATP